LEHWHLHFKLMVRDGFSIEKPDFLNLLRNSNFVFLRL
jgi:hypothetical protein